MITKELLKLPVSELVPYENNPRVISPEAVNACAESMRQCTALDPIEVDENNVILSGHTRRLALMQLHSDCRFLRSQVRQGAADCPVWRCVQRYRSRRRAVHRVRFSVPAECCVRGSGRGCFSFGGRSAVPSGGQAP